MSQHTLDAVVLRRWDSGETDRRLALLTRDRGKLFVMARGARKAKSPLAGASEPLVAATYEIAFGKTNNYVTQAQCKYAFTKIRTEFDRLKCGLAYVELLDEVLHPGIQLGGSFDLCLIALAGIETSKSPHGALVWGSLKMLELVGYAPVFDRSVVSGRPLDESVVLSAQLGGAVRLDEAENGGPYVRVQKIFATTLAKIQALDEPPPFVKRDAEVLRTLVSFLEHHLGRELPAMRATCNL